LHQSPRTDLDTRRATLATQKTEGNDNTESITNGVGFRNDISYGSIAPPVTYVLFAAFIVLMKAATVYAMRGLKQAK